MEPKERMRALTTFAKVDLHKNISAIRYYRSGVEMARIAKIYLQEGNLDSAYALYLRYCELFVEKIRQHPDFNQVPEEDKRIARENCKMMLSKAEELKKAIYIKYEKDYRDWLEAQEKERQAKLHGEQFHVPVKEAVTEPWLEVPAVFQRNGLRQIIVPSSLIPKFMGLAQSNTSKNIETCALLTGTLHHDRMIVTVLLVPQQSGTSDDCTAENDLATFNVIESRELITIGWIHTHPSQDAFLSSVDLHSQFGYQSMLPEAIAIVCAPNHSNEIFRLSDMGLDVIRHCSVRGFHPHPGPPLFETAPHAKLTDTPLEIVDLRLRP